MKIAIIGANGQAGHAIMSEALDREHEVVGLVRDARKLRDDRATVLQVDMFNLQASDLSGYDAVVNAFRPTDGQDYLHVNACHHLIKILQENRHTRLIVVGGAGSLFLDKEKTTRLIDTAEFPKQYMANATNQALALGILQAQDLVAWTFVSPSAMLSPGRRTGEYVLGEDCLLHNAAGKSYVSYEDYAVAIVDEIERPNYINRRFTVVSEE